MLGTFGVQGHLRCEYTTDSPQNIDQRPTYLLHDQVTGECRWFKTEEVELRQRDFLIRFVGYNAPEPLKALAGWDLLFLTRRGELTREANEIYYFELHGLEVRSAGGEVIGVVSDVLETAAHVLLEVDSNPSWLIPFTRMFVPEVNLEAGYLISTYPLDERDRA